MDVFKDAELIFADTYAQKPNRTLKIPASAPVQPTTVAVPPSAGVVEFTTCDAWDDRFVVWRAIGNKLLMEERSLCRSVLKGSLCFDFGRTSIVPGTSITIERSILCIVVPTQSAVHRFMARIVPDATHQFTEVNSFFTQINEKDFLGENHSYALLTTNAEVRKACVVHSMTTSTKVAYCMVDGQLVLITLPIKSSEKSEEIVLKEGGLISRIMNSAGSEFLCDVAGVVTPKGNAMFYGIYSDGTMRIWTVDKQIRSPASAKLTLPGSKIDSSRLAIRVYDVNGQRMVSIAAVEQSKTIFHNYSEESALLTYLFSNFAGFEGNLIDYQMTFNAEAGLKIYAIWDSNESGGYQLRYSAVTSKSGREVDGVWRRVAPSVPAEFDYSTLKLQQIKEIILDTDMHSFDVVVRAVQISSGSTQCEIAHNDWKALQSFIENYLRSTEFHDKYGDRTRAGKRTTRRDDVELMQRRFYEALAATCEQLIEADRGAVGLFIIDLDKAGLQGVIQKDRFSVIQEADGGLSIEPSFENALSQMVNALPKARDSKDITDSDESDDEIDPTLPLCQDVADKCATLMQNFCAHIKMPSVKPSVPYKNPFWGKFTAGLVAANVRHTVHGYLGLANSLLGVAKMLKNFDSEFSPKPSTVQALRKLQTELSFFSRMLDLKMMMTNNMVMTLGSWLFSVVDLDYIRSMGAAPPEPPVKMNFNWFLDTTLDAALRALWHDSPHLIACRKLAEAQKYLSLKRVCVLYDETRTSTLRSAINYYTGIAYCGMVQAKKAVMAFEESAKGIEAKEEALHRALRPAGELDLTYSTLGNLYSKAIRYLHEAKHEEEVVKLAKTAIDGLPEGDQSKNRIYATLFNQLVHQNKWAEALDSIKANKDPSMREMTLRDFMTRILRAKEWKMVTNLFFGDLEEQVEGILLSAARLQDLAASPHLYEVLYAYYLDKNRLNKAAQIMLEYSMSLSQATQTPELFKRRRDALATALTVLELIPEADRFCYFPEEFSEEIEEEAIVPDSDDMDVEDDEPITLKRTVTKRRVVIVDEQAVQREWAMAKARLVILEDSILPPTDPNEILKILIDAKHYDDAIDVCREFDLDTTGLLSAVTTDTIMLDATQPLETPAWKRDNRRHDSRGIGDNWGVVRGLLSTARRFWPADSRPYRAVTTAILAHGVNIPCWLQAEYQEFDLPDFVRCLVDYDSLPLALDKLTQYIKGEAEKVTSSEVTTYVPYTVLNDAMTAASTKAECKPLLSSLNSQLRLYLDRISGYETAHRFGS